MQKTRILGVMSTPEYDKFDLEGLSLEDIEPANSEKVELPEDQPENEPVEQVVLAEPIPAQTKEPVDQLSEPELVNIPESADPTEGRMICPKCELEQLKAEQCSGCGVYVAKAQAQIGQSKIEITAVKF